MSCSKLNECDKEWPDWAKKAAKEYFPSWNRYLFQPKQFSFSSGHGLIRTYVGIILFGLPKNINNASEIDDLPELWLRYSKKERDVLERIVGQFKFNENHRAVINHTYLYLEDHTIQCVFGQLLADGKVNFIDVYGRVYKSWKHFCETNLLQSCQYLAPKDGIHKVDQKLEVLKSPGNVLPMYLKGIATGCTFVAIALAVTGVGLGIAAVLGGIGTVYCVGNSGYTLIDRYQHEQSIRFDNAESIVCWLTLSTAALNGVSWLAVKNASKIINVAGRCGKYSLMASSAACLGSSLASSGVHLYYLHQKRMNGEELTLTDALGVCVNILLTCGAAYNTREMYNFLSTLEVQVQPTGLMSNSNELAIDSCTDVLEVSQQTIPQGNLNFVLNISEELILKNFNERTQKVYYQCVAIGQKCEEFKQNKMDSESFCRNLVQHGLNLCTLLNENTAEVRAKVNSYLGNVPDEVANQVGQSVANATQNVKKIDEVSSTADPRTRDHIIRTLFHPKYVTIIHLAKNRIPHNIPHCEILSSFSGQLEYVIDEITSKVNNNYHLFVSRHERLLGKSESKELFSKFGINSKYDFANDNFSKVVEELEKEIQPVAHSIEMERITEKLCALYEEIFQKDAQIGTLETCRVMRESLNRILRPLEETFKTCIELYEFNFTLIGRKKALALTVMSVASKDRQLNQSDDENKVSEPPSSIFFDVASEKLDFNEIIGTLWKITNSGKQDNAQPSRTLSDDVIQSTLLSLCKDFFQKVKSNKSISIADAEHDERLKHIYDYFMKKFASLYQEMDREKNSNLQQLVELNEPFFDQHRTLVSKFRAVCASNKYDVFVSAEKHFRNEKHMKNLAEKYVSEYKLIDDVCTEVYKNKIVVMYSINKCGLSKAQDYKRRAAKLFDLTENKIQSVKTDKEIVVLRCNDIYITFQTKGRKSMYVMAIDTSKLPTSE